MNELLPDVFHWTAVWPDLFPLESYWIRTAAGSALIDPIERGGLGAIEDTGDVRAVIITSAWHERSARLFAKRTGASIHVPAGDVQRFEDLDSFETYGDGDMLPADLIAIGVAGGLPGEHALPSPLHGGTLFVGDALETTAEWTPGRIPLGAHPSGHPDPRRSLAHLLDHEFENLLPVHGQPIVGGAKTIFADLIDHEAWKGENRDSQWH